MEITKTIDGSKATLSLAGWLDTQAAPLVHDALNEFEPDIARGAAKMVERSLPAGPLSD